MGTHPHTHEAAGAPARGRTAPDTGSDIRALREAAGLDRAETARRAGVGVSSLAAWESGRRTPQAASHRKLMAVLRDGEDPGDPVAGSDATDDGAATGSPPVAQRRPYTRSEDKRIRSAVAAGRDLGALATSLGRPPSSVRRRARHLGAVTSEDGRSRARAPLAPEQREEILQRYANGESRPDIARAVGRSVHTIHAVIARAGIANRIDVSPVYQRPDGTRRCRRCGHWQPASAYGSGRRGTCRTCRLGVRAQPRIQMPGNAPARSGPRVYCHALRRPIEILLAECGSPRIAAERVGLGEDALMGIYRRGEHRIETTGLATADRILVAAGSSLDLLPDDAIITA